MHGFRDDEVLLPTEYNVIVISPPRGASGNFSWRILKSNFLYGIHGFQHNEVLLSTGYDVIVFITIPTQQRGDQLRS